MTTAPKTVSHRSDEYEDISFFTFSRWAVLAIVTLALMISYGWGFYQVVYYLLFGWVEFLRDRWGRVQTDWSAVGLGVGAMVLFVVGAIVVASRSLGSMWRGTGAAIGVCLVFVSIFTSGIGIIGLAHQIAWMGTSDTPFLVSGNESSWKITSQRNLELWAQLCGQWRGKKVASDVSHLSWESYLVTGSSPYNYDLMDGGFTRNDTFIQTNLPWDAEQNREFYSTQQRFFVNPGLYLLDPRGKFKYDERGYALNNYSANQLMMPDGRVFRNVDVPDGTSQTILLGEIRENFQPWAKPGNVRDVTLGINQDPNGFGGPFEEGCQFAMVDGSVMFIDEKIDPKVLEALATPSGGERVEGKEF